MGPIPYVSAVVDCGGTSVKCTIMNVEPSPEHVTLGMQVKLMTYSMGEDSEGTEAIAFGFEPIQIGRKKWDQTQFGLSDLI